MNVFIEARTFRAVFSRNLHMFYSRKSYLAALLIYPIPLLALNLYQYLGVANPSEIATALSTEYGVTSLPGMIILGTLTYMLYTRILWGVGTTLRNERWNGTMEALFLTPTSRLTVLLASGTSSLVEASWWIFSILAMSWGIFGIGFEVRDPLALVLVIMGTVLSLVALGVFFSGIFIVSRATDQLGNALQSPVRFFSGVMFPVSALPDLLQLVSYAIPLTYGIQALRDVALAGSHLFQVSGYLVLLYGLSVALIVVGYGLVRLLEKRAKRTGNLYAW